jgi:hypothetical protein
MKDTVDSLIPPIKAFIGEMDKKLDRKTTKVNELINKKINNYEGWFCLLCKEQGH